MANRTQTQLLRLIDADKAIEMLPAELTGLFDDNGGEPDGDEWMVEAGDVDQETIDAMVAAGVAKISTGWKVSPYTETNNYSDWCGFSSRNEAFFLSEDSAVACQNDESGIEDSANPADDTDEIEARHATIKAIADALWSEVYPTFSKVTNAERYQDMFEWLYNGDGNYGDLVAVAAEWNEYQAQGDTDVE